MVASHTYADNGTYQITVTIKNAGGNTATVQGTATVDNVVPTAAIQGAGVTVRVMGQVHQPFLSVPGTRIALEGGTIAGM